MAIIDLTGKDIGAPKINGSIQSMEGGFTIISGGEDIWNEKDQFHFGYQEWFGDFDFITRIGSLTRADLYSKAGIMARETLDPGSKHVFLLTFPDNSLRNNNNGGIEFAYRSETNGKSLAIYPPKGISNPPDFPVCFPNTWLRLKRSGTTFTSFYSGDGQDWKTYTTFELKIPDLLLVGLAVTSHNTEESVKSTFFDVSIQ